MSETIGKNGVIVLKHNVHYDNRGAFMESWKKSEMYRPGINVTNWVQSNVVYNHRYALRGLHNQPDTAKCLTVVSGYIIDYVYNKATGISQEFHLKSGDSLYIPPHLYHGYIAMEEGSVVQYMVTKEYDGVEDIIKYEDTDIVLPVDINMCTRSEKDMNA